MDHVRRPIGPCPSKRSESPPRRRFRSRVQGPASPGTALTSSTTSRPRSRSAIRSTPAISAPMARAAARASRSASGSSRHALGSAAQRHVGPPFARLAHAGASHPGPRPAARRPAGRGRDAGRCAGGRGRRPAARACETPARPAPVADPDQSPPFRSEERLDDDVAPERLERLEGFARRLAGPGRRNGQVPAASSSASVRYLSTAASTARGGLSTGTPAAATRCRASIRKTTCSRLPGGIIRTSTPSAASQIDTRRP